MKTAEEIIKNYTGRPLRIMEVCGTHTHEIFRLGIRRLLPKTISLISGPGCPVCVTPVGLIDEAIFLALDRHATICTFGDLIRVPGTTRSLSDARTEGAVLKTVYSPLDAVDHAEKHRAENVVFLAVGFETTTPSACLAVKKARKLGLTNFTLLTANKTMPNAYKALGDSADAFLYPGHVHAIIGTAVLEKMAAEQISGVVTGFTAPEILTALAVILRHSNDGKPFFHNAYPRVVRPEGNPAAVALMNEVMEPCDSQWRGLGMIPGSGMRLREAYGAFDARYRFEIPPIEGKANPACRCGDVLRGVCRPSDCKMFGKACIPIHPVGACMVSHEGACSAYYQYGDDFNDEK